MINLTTVKQMFDVKKLNQSLKEMTADRDKQLAKLKEFEDQNKDYIQSAETANQMKQKHKSEIDGLKREIETLKLQHQEYINKKDNEVVQEKNDIQARIVAESIRLVSSQCSDAVIDTSAHIPAVTPEEAYAKLQNLTGEEKQKFYEANQNLFKSILKNR